MLGFRTIYKIWRRDSSLVEALKSSCEMLGKTHLMFQESVRRLRHDDGPEARLDVYAEDRIINEYQINVRRQVLRYLAVTGTVNLTPGLVLISIVIDIERIGDYTKNITELAVAYPGKLTCGRHESRVRSIEEAVEKLFDQIRPVLESSDRVASRGLMDECSRLRQDADQILADLVQRDHSDLDSADAAATALYVRYLKRIGAHLLNVLSSVVNPFERIGYRESAE